MQIFSDRARNHFLVVVTLWCTLLINSCAGSAFSSDSKKSSTAYPAKKTNQKDSASESCLFVRSGTQLSLDQQKVYGNVGLLALVNAQGNVQSICTGMLIRPDVVLTAQHCVADVNQVPFQTSQLVYTLDPTNASVSRRVKSIIQWAERTTPRSIYRDVALVTLDRPYDETFPIFDIRQTRADSASGVVDLTMVGFGGYTNGGDQSTYSVGVRRFGSAKFNNFVEVPFPDYNNPNYLGTGDYLSILPGTQNQIICAGDSGSSLFWDNGTSRMIVGVTSLGSSRSVTSPGAECASTVEGLFVPSHQLRSWVSTRLGEIKSGDKLEAYSLMSGKVKSLVPTATGLTVSLDEVKAIDDGLSLFANEMSVSICQKGCSPLSEMIGAPKVGETISLHLVKVEDKIIATRVAAFSVPAVYPVEFQATIAEVPAAESVNFGRREKQIKLSNVKIVEGSSAVPLIGEQAIATFCTSGCSTSSSIKTVGLTLSKDKGVKVKGEVVEGYGLYIREIEAAASFNAEASAPKKAKPPASMDDDDDDDDDEIDQSNAASKSPKSKC